MGLLEKITGDSGPQVFTRSDVLNDLGAVIELHNLTVGETDLTIPNGQIEVVPFADIISINDHLSYIDVLLESGMLLSFRKDSARNTCIRAYDSTKNLSPKQRQQAVTPEALRKNLSIVD